MNGCCNFQTSMTLKHHKSLIKNQFSKKNMNSNCCFSTMADTFLLCPFLMFLWPKWLKCLKVPLQIYTTGQTLGLLGLFLFYFLFQEFKYFSNCSLLQPLMSHDPSDIILICWFCAQTNYTHCIYIYIYAKPYMPNINPNLKHSNGGVFSYLTFFLCSSCISIIVNTFCGRKCMIWFTNCYINYIYIYIYIYIYMCVCACTSSTGIFFSNSQKYIVWVKMIDFPLMPKI